MGIAGTLKAKAAKAKAAKGFLEKNVPIPGHFYVGQTEDDLMAPKKVILPFVLMLNLVLVAAFAGAMAYYSSPDSYLTDISIEPEYDFGAPSYNCTPLIADTHYGVRFNYDTCKALLTAPDTTTVFEKTIEGGSKIWRYYPFYGIKEIAISFPDVYIGNYHTDLADQEANGTAIFNLVKAKNDCESNGAATSAGYGKDDYLSSNPFDVYQTVTAAQPSPPQQGAGRRLLQQPAPGGGPAPAAAGPSYPCSISQAQAIEMFKEYSAQVDPCFFTKLNSPFSCVKKGPAPLLQRFSLAYANALLAQSVLSAIVVQIFFKIMGKKREDKEAADAADISEIDAVIDSTERGAKK